MAKNLSPKPPSPIEINPPSKEDNRYRYRIRMLGGPDYNAYLTYELPQTSSDRSILMVNAAQGLIPANGRAEYERLFERIKETARQFAGAKNIVNRLNDKEFADLPNVRVAVHKYGPVPVFVLPEKYDVSHFGKPVPVQIGIYPKIKLENGSRRNVNLKLPFVTTKQEFVRSLGVGLGLMFQRYLEDVGEGMYDIKHHLNLAGIFDRAKEIESILGESIKSKLDVVTPSRHSFTRPHSSDELAVRHLFESESDSIFTARYARQFALYFLNELYRLIGLESRSEYYLNGFRDIEAQFDGLLGAGYVRNARADLPIVKTLHRAGLAYHDNDIDTLREINVDGEPLWVRRFVQFARFIGTLNQERLVPTAGRIFVSYQHDVPATEILLGQINDYVKSEFPNRVEVLTVKEKDAGIRFKSPIKARIWLSDTVSEIVPKDTTDISDGKVKDYVWIAREAEYGLLLGKRVIYLVERGVDEERILNSLKSGKRDGGLIPSSARVPDWLSKRLVDSFTEHTRTSFSVSTTDPSAENLDPDVKDAIEKEAKRAIEKRQGDILLGFHKQFPVWARHMLKHIQETVPYPKDATKEGLAAKLCVRYPKVYKSQKTTEQTITKVWALVRQRSLLIANTPMQLMRLLDRRRYSGNLREILKRLRPELKAAELREWEKRILTAVVRDDDSVLL